MLETIWYLLILVLQVLQVNPQLQSEKFQIDVFVASKPAYSFVVQGNAIQGQIVNAETKAIFGEFESTRRLPQAYVVFPREALPPELEAAAAAAQGNGKDGGKTATKNGPNASPSASPEASDKPKDLYPFTIDYTKAIKQLVSFRDKPRQQLEYPEADRFLSSKDKAGSDKAAADKTTAKTPAASAAPTTVVGKPGTTPVPSASPGAAGDKAEDKPAMIEIRQYSNRLVLTADFIQTVIIVNFMP